MKLVKKITAAVTAMAMAVGMMSIGASAYSYSFNLHYNYNDHYGNITSYTKSDYAISNVQTVELLTFNRYYYSVASVTVSNSLDPSLQGTFTSIPPMPLIKIFDSNNSCIGKKVILTATLNNYNSGTYANATGNFLG